jgi:hypothetical protein
MNLHSIEAVIAPENRLRPRYWRKMALYKKDFFKENQFFEGRF